MKAIKGIKKAVGGTYPKVFSGTKVDTTITLKSGDKK